MRNSIAIVGMSCCYPDARSPEELWENVLSQRRAFRRIPSERLNLDDYFSSNRSIPDAIYSTKAAVIEGFEFDRVKFKVAGKTFRSADWAHWLALDIAEKTLLDADFLDNDELPKESTGVFLGNTLTGEFSRANTIRLRYPFVKRVVENIFNQTNIEKEHIPSLLNKLEKDFKEPFPEITEESLAGGLSNTIAGRICNYFDLKGGGFTIDGACSSSLLAVANACSSLVVGDVDVALAGGVDLSIDPFELIGFAKTGALTEDVMRVYDKRSSGFIPGEGCGLVLLMREEDAIRTGRKIYSVIKGWGISSDGSGGITRPEVEGQKLALKRAYKRAKFEIGSVAYFEGHGTGTSVGDSTELKALSQARRESSETEKPAVISSIKALIGHTKAAAGIAGLIKATMALDKSILPPTTGCNNPHTEIHCDNPTLKVLKRSEIWDKEEPLRAGVSSMGFGGINAHIVLENDSTNLRQKLSSREKILISSNQDSEVFLFADNSLKGLQEKIERISDYAEKLSISELGDLSVNLARNLNYQQFRAGIVASTPQELAERLFILSEKLSDSIDSIIDTENKIFFSEMKRKPRIGFLFSGQGSPSNLDGGLWRRRFEAVDGIYSQNQFPSDIDEVQTQIAQPAIVRATVAGLRILDRFDITAVAGIGHSLGELSALHWAGVFDEETIINIAEKRGKAMSQTSKTKGAMLSVVANVEKLEGFLQQDKNVVVAGFNAPKQTVVSGEEKAIEQLQQDLKDQNIASTKLPVSHAFHSPLVGKSAEILAQHLEEETFQNLNKNIYSTITGKKLKSSENFIELLTRQIISPVRFVDATEAAEKDGIDLWIEVGTGNILCGLIKKITKTPAVAIEAGSEGLKGLWEAVAASFAFGQRINQQEIFAGRFTKPFDFEWKPKFFTNPCELAPISTDENLDLQVLDLGSVDENIQEEKLGEISGMGFEEFSPVELVSKLVADRAELPLSAISAESRMLSDLHLNSITVGQIVTTAAKNIGAVQPLSPTEFADSSITEIASALEKYKDLNENKDSVDSNNLPAGLDDWVRPFKIDLIKKSLKKVTSNSEKGLWQIFAPKDLKFADKIRQNINKLSGQGVIVCLSGETNENELRILLEGAKSVSDKDKFVLVQDGTSHSGFARSFALENHNIITCIINLPFENENSIDWLAEEISATSKYAETFYDSVGNRFESIVRPVELTGESTKIPLSENDVLLVSGGAKGITAECVLALAKETNSKLALLGTSDSKTSREVSTNLERFRALNINFEYYAVDITDKKAVHSVVKKIENDLGKIRGVFHAAAKNEPILIQNLSEEKIQETLAVKIDGAKNLLSAIPSEQIKLFITFGSIIARTGLQGESAYGLANEWLTDLTVDFQAANPHCKCLAYEWSVWSSVGMANRVADLDSLIRQGISPISPEKGVKSFMNLLKQKDMPVSFVVMSRFLDTPTYKLERPNLPLWRFLEDPKVFYPDIELIVDIEISTANDPYLEDHKIGGERVLPAVMGMEAMAETAMALVGKSRKPTFRNLTFSSPIVVNKNESLQIRLLASANEQGEVRVALQSAETQFQINHFEGVCDFDNSFTELSSNKKIELNGHSNTNVELDPKTDLYGKILFHQGRFQRLENYKHLEAKECIAVIANGNKADWFSRYLPKDLMLGDPAMRDTSIHAIQACIPQATLIPVSVEEISIGGNGTSETNILYAKERSQTGDIFTYDIQVTDLEGKLHETWKGLRLQMVSGEDFQGIWAEPLLAVYLERKLIELLKIEDLALTLLNEPILERRERSKKAFKQILENGAEIIYRSDGKPETNNDEMNISASHCENLTLAVASESKIGCDIEAVRKRDVDIWRDLLDVEGFKLAENISQSIGENFDISATRIWCIQECLRKIGIKNATNISLLPMEKEKYCLVFQSGNSKVISYLAKIRDMEEELIFSILVKQQIQKATTTI